jgi:hypothetical protein
MPMNTGRRFLGFYLTMAALVGACSIALPCGCHAQSARQPSPSQKDSLENFLRDYLGDLRADDKTAEYFPAFFDLRDDGTQEVIVYFTGQHSCGSGGCTTLVLAPEGSSYKVVTQIAIAWPPIRVLATKSHGWHDIAVRVQGGGEVRGYEARLSFNGKRYPSNPSTPPSRRLVGKVAGKVVVPKRRRGLPYIEAGGAAFDLEFQGGGCPNLRISEGWAFFFCSSF